MINANKIVPVQKTDLLTLLGTMLNIANISAEALTGANGVYEVKTNSKTYICDAPVKSLDIDKTASSLTANTTYFVADYDFAGVTVDGTKVTATVSADAFTSAILHSDANITTIKSMLIIRFSIKKPPFL